MLFHSAAACARDQAVAAILTGMGSDGALGMQKLRQAGAHTIAQDEASCVVYGMPRAAVEAGAVCQQVSLDRIPGALLNALRARTATAAGPALATH
jgi:two-component system chemotaxis response regulator CheB